MISDQDLSAARANVVDELRDALPLHDQDARHEKLMWAIDHLINIHLALRGDK